MLTKSFLAAGARVYITGRKADGLEAAKRNSGIQQSSNRCSGSVVAAGHAGPRRCVCEQEPRLHVLINNAGRTWGAAFDKFPDSAWQNVFAVNVHAPFALAQGC